MAGFGAHFAGTKSPAGFPAVEAGMATSPKSVRYYVQLARSGSTPRLLRSTQAMTTMQSKKRSNRRGCCPVPNGNLQPFNHAAYQPHAEAMVAQDELTDLESREDALRRNETRYMLLKGDCETGEGDVILQPWLKTQEPNLLASDSCAEWIGALEQLGLMDFSERLDDLAGGSLPTASDRILFCTPSRKQRDK